MLTHIRDAAERINDVGEKKDGETVTGIRELTKNAENLSVQCDRRMKRSFFC
jgi:hypothetical protein